MNQLTGFGLNFYGVSFLDGIRAKRGLIFSGETDPVAERLFIKKTRQDFYNGVAAKPDTLMYTMYIRVSGLASSGP